MATVTPLSPSDRDLLHKLRHHRATRRHVAPRPVEGRSPGQQIADMVAGAVGSWRFILVQSGLLAAWIVGNALSGGTAWDPFPFILLNLLLSFQAAYTAPFIMMSQNRLSDIDRRHAEEDYQVNVKAELEIELLHQKIDLLREQEIVALTQAINALAARLDSRPA